jgi:CubicO group peptidase (beta-lactamase class C family)
MRRIVATGTFDHAIGWFRRDRADQSYVEHFGAGAGFWNVMRIYPAKDLGIVVMSNSTTSYGFPPVFAQIADLDWP